MVLPVSHFHVVFTLPEQLRALALHNQRKLYGLLFTAATQTVQALSRDPKYLDAELGITAVLHTWSRTLAYHPHLHCLVTAGGLSWDQQRWVDSRQKGRYLFPVKPMGRLFRGKFLAALRELYEQGSLQFWGAAASWQEAPAFETLLQSLRTQDWVVYAKRPMGGAEQVYAYLGRYTHRVGLSNHRLREVTATSIRFTTKGGQQCTLAPVEFIRRLLLHVLPAGFVKIRHYGLLAASHIKGKLERARSLLLAAAVQPAAGRGAQEASAAGTPAISATANPSQGRTEAAPGVVEQRQAEQEREPARCPRCGQAAVYRVPLSWAECPSMLLSLLHRTVLPWLRARDSC